MRYLALPSFTMPVWHRLLTGLCVGLLFLLASAPAEATSKTKPPRPPRPEPELKIVDLSISPNSYAAGQDSLTFDVTVQLPKELNGATVLEVSSLISSPSKTSLRFLSQRQDLPANATETADGTTRATLSIRLLWDGYDHTKQVAPAGTYAYEVRTKLLANGEKGLRTMMVSWPKRGTLQVK